MFDPCWIQFFRLFRYRGVYLGLEGLKLDENDATNSFLMLPMARNGLKWPFKSHLRPIKTHKKIIFFGEHMYFSTVLEADLSPHLNGTTINISCRSPDVGHITRTYEMSRPSASRRPLGGPNIQYDYIRGNHMKNHMKNHIENHIKIAVK